MIPFFNWLYHGDGSLPSVRCPDDERGEFSDGKFNTFEYKVLSPKNKKSGEQKMTININESFLTEKALVIRGG